MIYTLTIKYYKLEVVMRRFKVFILILALFFNIITVSGDFITKSNSYHDNSNLNLELPIWEVGNFWNYYIKLDGNPDIQTKVDVTIFNLNIEIIDEYTESFKLEIYGDIQGRVSTGELSGDFRETTLNGFILLDKKNLSVDVVEATIQGRLVVALIPIPFDVDINIHCTPSYNSIQFPLYVGKEWHVPSSRINGFINVSSILDSISVFLLAGGGTSQCIGLENITISSEVYECYKIITNMDINEIYYSSAVGNIVKMSGETYDFENILVELKNTNYIVPGAPNKPDIPSGETRGQKGIQYNYSTKSYDRENEDIFYLFDWGDGTFSNWLGPYTSNISVIASHIWNLDGSYYVKVKAKDINDNQSPWSDSLIVTMPKINLFMKIMFKIMR
jgi:hypothetical protein